MNGRLQIKTKIVTIVQKYSLGVRHLYVGGYSDSDAK